MQHSVLIIDDEKKFANTISKIIEKERPTIKVYTAIEEDEILNKIENLYYNIVFVDLRMDNFEFDGVDLLEKIPQVNPYAKIIVVSGYIDDYEKIIDLFKNKKINNIITKGDYKILKKKVLKSVDSIVEEHDNNPELNQTALRNLLSNAINEPNINLKGSKFEDFTVLLFNQMGFTNILKRHKDKSLNEVDLIIRNEINDNFFQKFSPYILVECKNTKNKVDKNAFIQFYFKLQNTNDLSNFGIIITSNTITRNTYIEAVRTSNSKGKIIFIDRSKIEELIKSNNKIQTLKTIIDKQVKDN